MAGLVRCLARSRSRRDPRTCALWARVSEGPGQTDTGWPKKVSRRVQDAPADLGAGRRAEGDRFGPRLLAAVFAATRLTARRVGRGPRLTCALWARVSKGPGQTDTGWPKKVSRRVQDAPAHLGAGGGAEGRGPRRITHHAGHATHNNATQNNATHNTRRGVSKV